MNEQNPKNPTPYLDLLCAYYKNPSTHYLGDEDLRMVLKYAIFAIAELKYLIEEKEENYEN